MTSPHARHLDRQLAGVGHQGLPAVAVAHVTGTVIAGQVMIHLRVQGAFGQRLLPSPSKESQDIDRFSTSTLCHELIHPIALVAEGRRLFKRQSVADNLQLGLWGTKLSLEETEKRYDFVYQLFPILKDRLGETAGVLSGGQQQMLAIAQAIIRRPALLMLDEPSLGLSPLLVDQVLDVVIRLREQGTTILLIEQMVERALEMSDAVYVMLNGQIIGHGAPEEVRNQDLIGRAYLGAGVH